MSALHSLTAELHAGFLTLAFACILVTAAASMIKRRGVRCSSDRSERFDKMIVYTDAAGYVASIAGVVGLILSAITGMLAWPVDALLDSPLVQNKIMLTVLGTVLWCIVVVTRSKFGIAVYNSPLMSSLFVMITFASYAAISVAGSMGAHLTIGESVLDPLLQSIHIDIESVFYLSTVIAIAIVLISAASIILMLIISRRRTRPAPEDDDEE